MTNKASQFYFRKSTHCIKENTHSCTKESLADVLYPGKGRGSNIIFMVAFKIYHKVAISFFSITYKLKSKC